MLESVIINSRNISLVLPAIALLGSLSAQAEIGFVLGLGASYDKNIYLGSKSDDITALPYIAYETERFHIGIDEISYALKAEENFEIEVFGEPRDLDDLERDAVFSALKRDTAVEIGLRGQYALGPVVLSAGAQSDVTDAHEGFETRIGLGTGAELFGGAFELSFGGIYRDEKLNHYLYGVDEKDAISNVMLYAPEGGWTSELDASYVYPFSDQMALIAGSSIEFLGDEAKDSPRLKKNSDEIVSGFVGLLWQF